MKEFQGEYRWLSNFWQIYKCETCGNFVDIDSDFTIIPPLCDGCKEEWLKEHESDLDALMKCM